MIYHRAIRIEFNHCDPAGIVFYPRYYEMINAVCENFFREVVGRSFAEMVGQVQGVPTVRIETDFQAPSRLGDLLDFQLTIRRLGETSATFRVTAFGAGQLRLAALLTLVWVSGSMKAAPWPEAMKARMLAFVAAS